MWYNGSHCADGANYLFDADCSDIGAVCAISADCTIYAISANGAISKNGTNDTIGENDTIKSIGNRVQKSNVTPIWLVAVGY